MTVTVVMPVFNAARWLPETLESLANQDYSDWRLIAVDDESQDRSLEILKGFSLRFPDKVDIRSVPNGGPSRARNVGLASAYSEYVALLDADDLWSPDKLSTQVAWMERTPEAVGCTCDYAIFKSNPRQPSRSISFDWSPQSLLKWALLEGTGPGLCSTLIVRRRILTVVGGFDEQLNNAEDTEFAVRLAAQGALGTIHRTLTFYRLSGAQGHRREGTARQAIEKLACLPPMSRHPAFAQRARLNLEIVSALGAIRNGNIGQGLKSLWDALTFSPHASTTFIALTVMRRTKEGVHFALTRTKIIRASTDPALRREYPS